MATEDALAYLKEGTETYNFLQNFEKFKSMEFAQRTHLLIQTFGERKGIKLSENFEQNFFFLQMEKRGEKRKSGFIT